MMPAATTAGRRREGGQTKALGRVASSWGVLALLLASNAPFARAVCEETEVACQSDDLCAVCTSAAELAIQDVADNQDECAAQYPDSFWVGSEGRTSSFCEQTGASYCCAFDATDAAETCLANSATVSYWTCLLEDDGCTLDDLPCYSGSDDDDLQVDTEDDDSTSAPVTPATSTTSTSSQLYDDDTSTSTSSELDDDDSSVSITTPLSFDDDIFDVSNCTAELEACGDDDECMACTSVEDVDDVEVCTDRYVDAYTTSDGENGAGNLCGILGARLCCFFEANDAAETCMRNEVVSQLFTCLASERECSSDDLPCIDGDEDSTTSSSSIDATPAPSAGSREIVLSPAPTINDGSDSVTAPIETSSSSSSGVDPDGSSADPSSTTESASGADGDSATDGSSGVGGGSSTDSSSSGSSSGIGDGLSSVSSSPVTDSATDGSSGVGGDSSTSSSLSSVGASSTNPSIGSEGNLPSSSTAGDEPSASPTASPIVTISDSSADASIVTIAPTTASRGIFMTTTPTSSPTTDYTGSPTALASKVSSSDSLTFAPSGEPTWSPTAGAITGGPSASPSSAPTPTTRDIIITPVPVAVDPDEPTVSAANVLGSRATFILAGAAGLLVSIAVGLVV